MKILFAVPAIGLFLLSAPAGAADHRASPSLLGPLGLNTVPSARMDKAGTVRLGASTLDPYMHGTASIQISDSFNVTLRQTAETSSFTNDPDRLTPGLDLKLRLSPETKYMPEISVGIIGALGHKRMAGEYVAASKRYKDFDFTAGLGWGRYGSSGTFDNPLGFLSTHFKDRRPVDGQMPSGPDHWFTGDNLGLFGGVEYFTPVDGLSLKLDYSADRYTAEKTAFNFDPPDPWTIGVHYAPTDWADIGVGVAGTEKIMATLYRT